jgi:uncharacterized protein
MKIAVISDTHGFVDPQLPDLLAGVDAILHGGDVGSEEVLAELRSIAKMHAVMGNVDLMSLGLPPSLKVRFENLQIEILHQLPAPQSELRQWSEHLLLRKLNPERCEAFLKNFDAATQVVIYGHTHQPSLDFVGTTLFFNPGSAGKKRFSLPRCFGILEVFPRGVRASVVSLEEYNEKLPPSVWLPMKEERP